MADYDFAVVDNRHANRFYLIFFHENDSFANYTGLPEPAALDYSQRNALYCSLNALADVGVFVPLDAVLYNKTTGRFSLFDYSGVIIDETVDADQKQEYIDLHKKFLLI